MARYTETLHEYLKGNTLPEEFNEISGFAEIFTAHFIDREIGFETEELFKIKLSGRACIVIPSYKERITAINAEIAKLSNPSKILSENKTLNFGEQATNFGKQTANFGKQKDTFGKQKDTFGKQKDTFGKQKSKTTELPINSADADPNVINESDDYENERDAYENERDAYENERDAYVNSNDAYVNSNDAYVNSENLSRTESGKNASDVIASLNYLNGKVRLVLKELLGEFDSLFMQVY